MANLSESAAWKALQQHQATMQSVHMRTLFADDPGRAERYSLTAAGLFMDYSKNRVTDETLKLLLLLAHQQSLPDRIEQLLSGQTVNTTEKRAALHSALRNQSDEAILVDGEDVMPAIRAVQGRMRAFSDGVRDGSRTGLTGKRFTDIVNIGIGGSDLGPLMVTEALKKFQQAGLTMHFVSNVDGSHISEVLGRVSAESTLFIVASKTFTTQETLTNAFTARDWFLENGGTEAGIAQHFIALSTNAAEVSAFGIDTANMFEFWDWVGGRYSLWSAIGMPIAIALGMDRYMQLLEGAHAMDKHFRTASLDQNMPVICALLTVWYSNFFGAASHLIAPYDQYLHRFPAYLQQLTMESNGKSVNHAGESVVVTTGPIVWGEPGTNGQHAYFQLVHQGTHLIPADFIVPMESLNPVGDHHDKLLANCIAQTEALMMGKTDAELAVEMRDAGASDDEINRLSGHRRFDGNRPTNTLLLPRVDPYTLGALIALYEHKVFVESVIWDINAFDQWGVELGKQMAKPIHQEIASGSTSISGHDASTNALINRINRQRNLHA